MSSTICITWNRDEKRFIKYLFPSIQKLFSTWKYEMGPYLKKSQKNIISEKFCTQIVIAHLLVKIGWIE